VVNIFEKFSTPYFNSSKQDPMVKSQNKIKINQFMQFTLEVVVLEYSFLNHCHGILGISRKYKEF
jgi:hypothetical protein